MPLWNPATVTATTFTLYSSPIFNANLAAGGSSIGQPDGPSRLCLGCHDGSYTGAMNGVTLASVPAFNFGSDLSRTHPISFAYTPALAANTRIVGELNNPVTTSSTLGGTIDTDLLDQNHKVQCTTCHNVHTSAVNQTYTDQATRSIRCSGSHGIRRGAALVLTPQCARYATTGRAGIVERGT